MKKQILFILLLLFSAIPLEAQTIEEIFHSLPAAYTPELTETAKDSLVQFNSYSIPGDDPREIMKVSIIEKDEDFMRLQYYFTTGQRAFINIEIRVFTNRDGEPLIVYARYGGLPKAFDQHMLTTFNYSNGSLTRTIEKLLPETIAAREFLKPEFVENFDSELQEISTGYDLDPEEKNSIEYKLEPQFIFGKDHWIHTYSIFFRWNGEIFEKREK